MGPTSAQWVLYSGRKSSSPLVDTSLHAESMEATMDDLSVEEWLRVIDESGFLLQYKDSVELAVGTVQRAIDTYWKGSELDTKFFRDIGVVKLGHKRLFQKWFKDNCA